MANNIIGTVGIGAASVQPDYNQNDPKAKNYIKNRPGGYVIPPTFAIEWDGDTTGRETVVIEDDSAKVTYVKIADAAPSIEVFIIENGSKARRAVIFKYCMQVTVEIEMSDGTIESETVVLSVNMYDNFWIAGDEHIAAIGVEYGTYTGDDGATLSKGLWVAAVEKVGK